jgi:hypothetical protein
VLIGFSQSISFPKNVSSAYTDKHWKADQVVFAQRHNFRWASSQLSSYTKHTANRSLPKPENMLFCCWHKWKMSKIPSTHKALGRILLLYGGYLICINIPTKRGSHTYSLRVG